MTFVRAIFQLLRTSIVLSGTLLIGLWVMEPIDVVRHLSGETKKEQWLIDCVPAAGDGGSGKAQATQFRQNARSETVASIPDVHLFHESLNAAEPSAFNPGGANPSSPHRPLAHLRGPPVL